MRLLPKIRALQRRCAASQQRCEAQLAQLAREDDALRGNEDALASQAQGIRHLLETQRPAGTVLDRGQLSALLRKQAVLRRQLQNLNLQLAQLNEQRLALAVRRDERLLERRDWLRKDDKYQRWASQLRKQDRLFRLRQDEAEQEERTQWKP
ncbi:hypothetical protein [Chromobacterium amazonense]|uniref:hypothetical protein n=1 Tax=Chromobacterium amazonense TaxID=1382803 RepID=UPI0031F6CBB3